MPLKIAWYLLLDVFTVSTIKTLPVDKIIILFLSVLLEARDAHLQAFVVFVVTNRWQLAAHNRKFWSICHLHELSCNVYCCVNCPALLFFVVLLIHFQHTILCCLLWYIAGLAYYYTFLY